MTGDETNADVPILLKAIDLMLADPKSIQEEAKALLIKLRLAHPQKSEADVQHLAAKKIISNYSYYAAFSGGTTALSGVVPGIGTVVATFGGSAADAALCMKFQIEMTMAIASVYGHDILIEEEKRLCYIIAGLGALNRATKEGGKALGSKAFIKMAEQYLKGPSLAIVKEIFKKLGITFTRSALTKAIPFGIGVVIGFSANKGLSMYVGSKARDFFANEA